MTGTQASAMTEDDIELLRQAIAVTLETDDRLEIAKILSGISISETTMLLDSVPTQQRDALWPLIDPSQLGAILLETQDEVSDARLRALDPEEIATIVESLADKLLRILHTLAARYRVGFGGDIAGRQRPDLVASCNIAANARMLTVFYSHRNAAP